MRLQTDCACGATFTLDDGGRDDVCTRNQFNERHAAWNALHAACTKHGAAGSPAEPPGPVCGLCGGTGILGDAMMSDCPRGCGKRNTSLGVVTEKEGP